MKRTIISIFILASVNAFPQTETLSQDDFSKELQSLMNITQTLQKENESLKSEIINLNNKLSNANKSIDSLRILTQENKSAISQTASELGIKISVTELSTNEKITEVDKSLSKKSLYGIIGVLLAMLISILIYWLFSRRQKSDKTEIIEQLSKTKLSIEESLVKQFSKQTELMESQLKLIEQQNSSSSIQSSNQEPDHSLAMRVASEINLIERNLSLMDNTIKGYKQLKKSVEKLKDNLNANGYEILELLGKPYHPGLPVTIINSFPDENLEKDQEIISKILIPAVRYKDKIIQSAQVEVSVGV